MKEKCVCDNPGFCKRHNCQMTERYWQYCRGTSGLPTEVEELYLDKLKDKVKKQKEPNFLQKAVNFTQAVVNHALGGFKIRPEEDIKLCQEICQKCEYFNSENESCRLCGCNLSVKSRWNISNCPHPNGDKWAEALQNKESN